VGPHAEQQPDQQPLVSAPRAFDTSKRHVIVRLDGSDLVLRYGGTSEVLPAFYERAGVAPPPKPYVVHRDHAPACRSNKDISTTIRSMHTDWATKRDAINAPHGSEGSN
jgi:hypothetical protein